jgi:hypothetical protein
MNQVFEVMEFLQPINVNASGVDGASVEVD